MLITDKFREYIYNNFEYIFFLNLVDTLDEVGLKNIQYYI